MVSFKQVMVLRSDLEMSEGKKIVQACHASLGAFEKTSEKVLEGWRGSGMKKVTVAVEGSEELLDIFEAAKEKNLPAYLVKDAGKTELDPGTPTCVGIGPGISEQVDKVTGHLKSM